MTKEEQQQLLIAKAAFHEGLVKGLRTAIRYVDALEATADKSDVIVIRKDQFVELLRSLREQLEGSAQDATEIFKTKCTCCGIDQFGHEAHEPGCGKEQ